MRAFRICLPLLCTLAFTPLARAETIRVAIGVQDTTINCAAGGLLIRELGLIDRYLPRGGKYKDATYDIQWKNFTSGAPITNEMVAGKLDFGVMADFPGALNGVALRKAGRSSSFIVVLSGSEKGSGNGVVAPIGSNVQTLADLKGKTISVPFASTAHGMLLRAIADLGWTPDKDIKIISQAPEVAGSALQSGQIDAHADFVPFAELFPYRGFARKIFDGAQAGVPTFHGTLVNRAFADKYPEVATAYLRAAIEANRLLSSEPEKYSELIARVTGIEAPVVYLFLGPHGLQTRDMTWRKEYRRDIATSIETLLLLKRVDTPLDADTFIDERFIREAFAAAGLDYDATRDEPSRRAEDDARVAELWLEGETKTRRYESPEAALRALAAFEQQGKRARAAYVQDSLSGVRLFADRASFVREPSGEFDAFLSKVDAAERARRTGGVTLDFAAAKVEAASAAR
jgi:NitT/TauT family transport system substrate-binding protein